MVILEWCVDSVNRATSRETDLYCQVHTGQLSVLSLARIPVVPLESGLGHTKYSSALISLLSAGRRGFRENYGTVDFTQHENSFPNI